ncbi:MAG TPA: MogA/MoaB family molybdenum cofactor biosynthesis protein [Polyangiaceae bacterium]|jgi:molybdenum cofactor biosynthesis protein B
MAQVRILLVTVSDTRSSKDDASGDVLAGKLGEAGFAVRRHMPVRDEMLVIRELVRSASVSNEADAIILCGGTGLAPRDVTPEAIEPLYQKRIDGFGEEFRRRSWSTASPWRSNPDHENALGGRAMLSRATAGVVHETIVVAIPGSPEAAELGASLLVDMLPHAVEVASGRHGHHSGTKK